MTLQQKGVWQGLVLNGAMCGISVACGADAGVDPGPVVQGGVEAEGGAGEPEEDGGQAEGGDRAQGPEDMPGAVGEVRGSGGDAADRARGGGCGMRRQDDECS